MTDILISANTKRTFYLRTNFLIVKNKAKGTDDDSVYTFTLKKLPNQMK